VDSRFAALLSLQSTDPHAVLGAHPVEGGVVFRALRPGASKVTVCVDNGQRIALAPVKEFNPARGAYDVAEGLFEGQARALALPLRYQLEVSYPKGDSYTLRDPYAFLPTIGDLDLHFAGEGRHERLWDRLGAHPVEHQGIEGTTFAVWAPNARGVSVVGDFNGWDGRLHQLRAMGASGIWEIFVPAVAEGSRYKFEIRGHGGGTFLKADPLAFRTEHPPLTASVVHSLDRYEWGDDGWLRERKARHAPSKPMTIYEVHSTSWRTVPEEGGRPLSWRELAPLLADHVEALGFTHVEFLPVAEHPFGGSWGYQVSSYFAPTARHGDPDDFRFLVDTLHQRGIGVIVDWVPGHFPRDAWALAQFDGTALYEHADPRKGAHPDWGTLIFNFGRNEVRNFLFANALFWLEQYHVDGLRVDAVASMLYLDYSRAHGEWLPNPYGGRENLEAIGFLKELNDVVGRAHPGTVVIAEESTAWPKVSQPTDHGGLGFTHKWNMGWMHDTLDYFKKEPIYRRYHHHQLTFGLMYAWSERFVLPLSHDEVVHGKGSLLGKMPGDAWQKFANLRALYGWMWGHPGKKLLFMGAELAPWSEWNNNQSLDWHLQQSAPHAQMQAMLAALNKVYLAEPSLHAQDFSPEGFEWVQANQVDFNVYAFLRHGGPRPVLVVANLSPLVREGYRVGVPWRGRWAEIFTTDDRAFGGAGIHNHAAQADDTPWDGKPHSVVLTLPPLAVTYLAPG
jgi:1,4-alpha-glucan branching enzyme